MARLTIVVEVPDGDPPREDPEDVADELLFDTPEPVRVRAVVYAAWGETLRGNALQIGDANTQINNFGPD